MKHICIHSHARKLAKSGTVSYPATAKLLMRDRLCQVVNIGHCYSNIIEDAQHHFEIHFQSEVVHNIFTAATREGLSHLQMPMCLDKAIFRVSVWVCVTFCKATQN